jgi:hypothetical protein
MPHTEIHTAIADESQTPHKLPFAPKKKFVWEQAALVGHLKL